MHCAVVIGLGLQFGLIGRALGQRTYPPQYSDAESHIYKVAGEAELKLFVFKPQEQIEQPRPAIVFFFGGGWAGGSPAQFEHQCRYLASRGMVAIAADYRVASRHNVKVVDCVRDAKSAVRWVREHADDLGVDPERIVAAGGSAGGHLAACTALLPDFDEASEDAAISSRPAALVLFNPLLSFTAQAPQERAQRVSRLMRRLGAERKSLSPADHIDARSPPTLVLLGTEDYLRDGVEQFAANMENAGRRCQIRWYQGRNHGFFNFERSREDFLATLEEADRFLESLGYLEGSPTVDAYFEEKASR